MQQRQGELEGAYGLLRDAKRRRAWDRASRKRPPAPPAPRPAVNLESLQRTILDNPRELLPVQAPDIMRRGVPKSAAVRRALQLGLGLGDQATPALGDATPAQLGVRRLQPPRTEVLGADTRFCGALLRRLRESAGASLQDVSDITKISKRYICALENDDAETLPASVYVRGFVGQYARALGLDAPRVTKSYMALLRRPHGSGAVS
ncbi:MAG: hypothetical protein EOO40_04255 [Deltaproteobacteria bacterium]|nr:MAG: hypothetical protein EOO40_04255 [Deltaproteobacteria bacterium]